MSARRRPRSERRPRNAAAVRRGLLLGLTTLPVVALIAVVVVKIVTMSLFAQLAVWFTDNGDHKAALTVSEWNLTANVYEPYKAHYNVGTAMLNLGLNTDARDHLAYSLTLGPPPAPEGCWIRTNLSLAVEGQGDAAERRELFDEAALYYAQAKAFLAAADPACATESSSDSESEDESEGGGGGGGGEDDSQGGGGGTFGEQSAESQERLDDKQQQAEADQQEKEQQEQSQGGGGGTGEEQEQEGEGGDGGTGGDDGDQQGQAGNPFDDLGDRMDEAERARQRGTGVERSESGSNPYPDKPW